jgi:beta-galactosidase
MSKLLLFMFLFSRDTIITTLAPGRQAAPRSSVSPQLTPAPVTLRIINSSATRLNNITLEWSVQTNGSITRKGKTPIPTLAPNQPTLVRLPLHLPDDSAGESFLQLRFRSATTLLTEQEILLKPWRPSLTIPAAGEITLSDENDLFTIHSPTIRISFNRQTGWLVHYEIHGIDLLDDTLGLKTNFWWPGYIDSAKYYAAELARHRADSANNYTMVIDSGWQSATREPHLQLFSNTTSPEQIIIRTEYTLPATASLLHLSYTINANGEMLITQQVEPDTTQPPSRPWPMPCFGMQWIMPPGYDSITAYGPIDPTRIGIFHDRPLIPSTPNPQARAAATHSNIRWWTITNMDGNGLQFIADTPLLNESVLHSFDSDFVTTPARLTPRPQIQISIDRPVPAAPATQPEWPILLPMGNLRYVYKVKPLLSFHHP